MSHLNRKMRHDLVGLLEPLSMAKQLISNGRVKDGLELLDFSIDSISNLANSFGHSESLEHKIADLSAPYNSIIIDDDSLYLETCKFAAKSSSLQPLLFSSYGQFEKHASELNKLVPLFIDSELGNDREKGEMLIPRLRQFGFKQIYINTADVAFVGDNYDVEGVLNKEITEITTIVESFESSSRGSAC